MTQNPTPPRERPELTETDEDDFILDPGTVLAIREAGATGDAEALKALMEPLHPADIADLLEQVAPDERGALVRLYGEEFDGDILSEIDETIRDEVVAQLSPEVLSDAVRELDTDDVVDLLEDLESPAQQAVLEALDRADRVAVEQALTWPEHSAGRLMQRELVMGPDHWTVGEAIDYLRDAKDLPDQFYHLILVTPRMEPIANVTLGRILSSRREVKLKDIAEETFRVFEVTDDEADVAYAFNQYHLISSPVVDDAGRLVGMITIDDAMTVLAEESQEDILRLAGVGADSSVTDRVSETVCQRLPWLVVNLLTAMISATVIAQFDKTIEQIVALAVLMPIVASMGGNAGTQTLTVAVRALATRDLTAANIWRVFRRELIVGVINGAVFALALGAVGLFWFSWPMLGAVLALAIIINLIIAGLVGIGVPVLLEKIGVDPALASGTFVMTVTDVVGFFAFLGLATVMLL